MSWSNELVQGVGPVRWSKELVQGVGPGSWSKELALGVGPVSWSKKLVLGVGPGNWSQGVGERGCCSRESGAGRQAFVFADVKLVYIQSFLCVSCCCC